LSCILIKAGIDNAALSSTGPPLVLHINSNYVPLVAAIVGGLSGFLGVLVAALASAIAGQRSVKQTTIAQTTFKIADFRQAWINDLRNSMAEFQSFCITPGFDSGKEREAYRLGTKIQLLMNRNDPDYKELYEFVFF